MGHPVDEEECYKLNCLKSDLTIEMKYEDLL